MDNFDNQVIELYKTHTLRYVCDYFKVTKYKVNKILEVNNIEKHCFSETANLSRLEKPTQGNFGLRWYNNGNIQKMFKPDEQPDGWTEGGIPWEKTKIELAIEKRGFRSPMCTEKGKQNYFRAINEKYGTDNIAKVPKVKEKTKQTNLEKYGTEYIMQNPDFKEKSKNTCQQKYDSDYWWSSKKFRALYQEDNIVKSLITKKQNHTFNTSKPEENYYEYLKTIYDEADIIRQYKDKRYPFCCDFYIKSKDLFIELNLHWTHGYHPFDKSNPEDLEKLAVWQEKAKTSKFYENAIITWTNRDIKKRNFAYNNGLNYIEIFEINID